MKIMIRDKIHIFFEKFVRNFVPELRVDKKSLRYFLLRRAVETSAEFIEQNMHHAQPFETRDGLYRYILAQAPKEGMVLEFGVHDGHSINAIAKMTDKSVHGFDSFEGLPDDGIIPTEKEGGAKWFVGKMGEQGRAPKVRENVILHKGWFDEVLPKFYQDFDEKISMIHIDSDIYSSALTVLENSKDRMVEGTCIIFDDYLNYDGWQKNEHRALTEFAEKTGMKYEFIAYNYAGGASIRVLGFSK